MNDTPDRFSQAQVLIAALFAVVFTGELPDGVPTAKTGQIRPLEEEFAEIFDGRGSMRSRLTRASIGWIEDKPQNTNARQNFCRHLTRTPFMPSAVAAEVTRASESRGATGQTNLRLSFYRGIAAEVSRNFGVDPNFVAHCYNESQRLDEAWHKCRAELLKIRAARQGVKL